MSAPSRAGWSSEHERIQLLRALFGAPPAGVTLSIGDDAAVLDPGEEPLVWSIDAAVEGVHFRRGFMSLEDVGYRATMAALSDLAAMGARAAGVLSSLICPPAMPDEDLLALARGQRDAAADASTAVIGGNLARGDELSITTSVLGRASRPLTRAGARAGDGIFVAGELGWSAAGLSLLRAGARVEPAPGTERALRAFRRPRAQLARGLAAVQAGATAAIDVSDGLAADLAHVAKGSSVDLLLDESALGDPDLAALALALGGSADAWVLQGGEDYALVAFLPRGVSASGFREVGRCVEGAGQVWLVLPGGERRPLTASGFDHFR